MEDIDLGTGLDAGPDTGQPVVTVCKLWMADRTEAIGTFMAIAGTSDEAVAFRALEDADWNLEHAVNNFLLCSGGGGDTPPEAVPAHSEFAGSTSSEDKYNSEQLHARVWKDTN